MIGTLARRAAMLASLAGMALASAPATGKSPLSVQRLEAGVNRMGPAEAEVALTEYISYTCSHCAAFETEAGDRLKLVYVGSGRVSVEYRHFVRDGADLTAALLTNCGPASKFAGNHAMVMREQETWLGKLQDATTAQRARYQTGTQTARRQALARDAGFYAMFAQRGYDRMTLNRCLADDALAEKLAEKTQAYAASGVAGTPSFAIDDELLSGVHAWSSLKPQLDSRLK